MNKIVLKTAPRKTTVSRLAVRRAVTNAYTKEPGLDGRHRNKDGEIHLKRGDTINKNLASPIPEFSPNAKLSTMRKETGKTSIKDVAKTAKNRK